VKNVVKTIQELIIFLIFNIQQTPKLKRYKYQANKETKTCLCCLKFTCGIHYHRRSEVLNCGVLKIWVVTMHSIRNDVTPS